MWKSYYLMPKNVFTLSMFALPVYTLVLCILAAAWRRVLPMDMRKSLRIGLSLLLPALTLHALPLLALAYIVHIAGLPSGSSEQMGGIVITYGWVAALIIVGQSIVYYIPFFLLGLLPLRSRSSRLRDYVAPRSRSLATVLLITFIALYTTYRTAYDAVSVQPDALALPLLSQANPAKTYTIAAIADLQYDEFTGHGRVQTLLAAVAESNPDLILIAGDFVTTERRYLPDAGDALATLRAPDGVMTVLGDHDYWTDYDSTVSTIAESGVQFGANTVRYIPIGSDTLSLIFVTNCMPARIAPATLDSLLKLPRRSGPSVLLVHDAKDDIIDAAVAGNIDLVIGGHTHGSQIAIDFFGYNLTRLLMDSRHVSGYYTQGNTAIYICNGMGMSVAPIRYNATPSFGVITLNK